MTCIFEFLEISWTNPSKGATSVGTQNQKLQQLLPQEELFETSSAVAAWGSGESLHGGVGWVLLPPPGSLPAPHSPCCPVGDSGPLQAL